jgi:hypothetical protein
MGSDIIMALPTGRPSGLTSRLIGISRISAGVNLLTMESVNARKRTCACIMYAKNHLNRISTLGFSLF